jgi:MoaA/NifB/PqqE/SkfB family radical SAM enzyme
MNKFPEIVTFRITSECKNSCRYCYGPKNIPRLEIASIFRIIDTVAKGGAKGMVITGGEPLLMPDIETIIRYIRSRKLNVYLDTSGENFFKHNYFIDKNVSVLGIPIDEYSEEGSYRRFGSHLRRLDVLNYYKNSSSALRPLLRVGTVVTKENIGDLDRIAELVSHYPVDLWKIYQFLPLGETGSKNKGELSVSNKDFIKAAEGAQKNLSKKINVIFTPKGFRSNAYFMINPDGSVFMPEEEPCREIAIGSIFDSDIAKRWREHILENDLISNAERTFSYKWGKLRLDNINSRVLKLAEKYYAKSFDYSYPHIEWMMRESISLAKNKKIDQSILLPLIILHDVGYSKTKDNPFFSRSRIDHMKFGKKIALDILKKANYDQKMSGKIADLVSIHDNWALGDKESYQKNPLLGVFDDLHHTSALSDSSFPEMSHYLDKSDAETLKYLNDEGGEGHDFTCKETKQIHNKCYIKKKFDIISCALS